MVLFYCAVYRQPLYIKTNVASIARYRVKIAFCDFL